MKKINKAILKEYKAMSLHSFSDGQIEVDFPNENDLTEVRVFLKPNGGFYKDGKFQFAVKLPEDYPARAPSVTCKTKMFHPNINYEGENYSLAKYHFVNSAPQDESVLIFLPMNGKSRCDL